MRQSLRSSPKSHHGHANLANRNYSHGMPSRTFDLLRTLGQIRKNSLRYRCCPNSFVYPHTFDRVDVAATLRCRLLLTRSALACSAGLVGRKKGCYPSRSGGCFAAIQRWKFNVINGRRKRRKNVIRSSLISLRLGRFRASTSNAMSNSDGQNSHRVRRSGF